jgi:peptidoglycan/LPS O-acetylase OafA/YrhL
MTRRGSFFVWSEIIIIDLVSVTAPGQRESPKFATHDNLHDTATIPIKQRSLEYRPAIDGLRALAVLAVFIFHLNSKWLSGGFVGVDVFFVISGYLITSIIFKECKKDAFSLKRFYQRRIARIAPAFFLVGLSLLGAGYFIYSAQDLAYAGSNFTAAVLSVANIKFMTQGNYFQIFPDAKPFVHYWSLSVEEQYYVFFPLFFLLLFKYARKRQVAVLSVLAVASFVSCVVVTHWKPMWAFFLLPTRAFELMAGGILALIEWKRSAAKIAGEQVVSAGGVLIVLGSFIFIHEGPGFPGYWSLIPVVGAIGALIPIFGKPTISEKMLASPPLVLLGRMSYSLYLWHWPIFSLVDYSMFASATPVRVTVKVGLSFIVAAFSYYLVEKPARSYLNRPKNMVIAYTGMAFAIIACALLGVVIREDNYVDARSRHVAKGGFVYNSADNKKSVVLMGDSYGSMYGKVMKQICAQLDYKLTVISVSAANPLPDSNFENGQFWRDSLRIITNQRPDFVIFGGRWDELFEGDGREKLAKAVSEIKPFTKKLILLNEPPMLDEHGSREAIRKGARPPFLENKTIGLLRVDANNYLWRLNKGNVFVLDVASHFEAREGGILFLDEQGRQMYNDWGHLSSHGAERMRAALTQAISTSASAELAR